MRNSTERGIGLVELLIVVAIAAILTTIAVPSFVTMRRSFRISGDARDLNSQFTLAKMRAASDFTKARVYADTSANSTHVEVWDKSGSGSWKMDGGDQPLQHGVSVGFGTLSSAPQNTQGSIAEPPQCLDSSGNSIANTVCVLFNSRGVPVDTSGSPGPFVMYLTDGYSVYAVSVSTTGLILTWRSDASSANWKKR